MSDPPRQGPCHVGGKAAESPSRQALRARRAREAPPGQKTRVGDGLNRDRGPVAGGKKVVRLKRSVPRLPHESGRARGLPDGPRCQGCAAQPRQAPRRTWETWTPRGVDRGARRFGMAPALQSERGRRLPPYKVLQIPGRSRSRRAPAGRRRRYRDAETDRSRHHSRAGQHGVGRPLWGGLRGRGRHSPHRCLRALGGAPCLRRRLPPGRGGARAAGVRGMGRLG
jgi:hypothetical protein